MSILNLPSLSPDQNGTISDLATQLRDLKEALESFIPIISESDVFHWKLNPSSVFSVASVTSLVSSAKDNAWPTYTIKLLETMWKSKVPKKVHIFSLRFFIDRLPLKDLLLHRGVTNFTSLDCVICSNHPDHRFTYSFIVMFRKRCGRRSTIGWVKKWSLIWKSSKASVAFKRR
ncbi:uncharacterized protein LOC131613524 [Vicia villosa]|uniref:uncharacterized protein LOC131613524 n=1 Tax=Vicia villosa TaxID=3911 RepID=UPI00273B08E0|nr:uncharacterized protein LOC131613524 [Vicia villosa]